MSFSEKFNYSNVIMNTRKTKRKRCYYEKNWHIPRHYAYNSRCYLTRQQYRLIRFNWNFIWPLFLLIPGLMFELSYFGSRRNPGVLVPGGILTVYSVFFYFNIITGWNFMDNLWPVFLLGPSFWFVPTLFVRRKRKRCPDCFQRYLDFYQLYSYHSPFLVLQQISLVLQPLFSLDSLFSQRIKISQAP